jgi:hypothetical protein
VREAMLHASSGSAYSTPCPMASSVYASSHMPPSDIEKQHHQQQQDEQQHIVSQQRHVTPDCGNAGIGTQCTRAGACSQTACCCFSKLWTAVAAA